MSGADPTAFPEAYLDHLCEQLRELEDEVAHHGFSPENAPANIAPHWRKSACFMAGRYVEARRLGIAEEFAIGEDRLHGGYYAAGYRDDRFTEEEAICQRLNWIVSNTKGGHTVWWYRRDTGDGILLDSYAYMVAFDDPADDVAFVAEFGGATDAVDAAPEA